MTLRQLIADPTEYNISHLQQHGLYPFFCDTPPPQVPGRNIPTDKGFANVLEWGWEVVTETVEKNGYGIVYIGRGDPGEYIVLSCLDTFLEPWYELMTGADHGEGVTALVAQHWPRTFQLMKSGNGMSPGPGIIRVQTGVAQWAVADFFADDGNREEVKVPDEIAKRLSEDTVTVARDVLGYATTLPGLLGVLAQPDVWDKRLKNIASILNGIGSLK